MRLEAEAPPYEAFGALWSRQLAMPSLDRQ